MQSMKTWLITGVSRGLGLALARAVTAAGDKVIGTVRSGTPDVPGMRVLQLDVSDPSAIASVVREAGPIDVLVNNAGFGLLGAAEDATEEETARIFEVNVFGTMRMIRAVLPGMRKQRSGHIINITSIAGRAPGGGAAVYSSAKAAVEGYSAALAQEVAPFGIKVTAVAPGAFRTDFLTDHSIARSKEPSGDYADTVGKALKAWVAVNGKQAGDPDKAAQAIIKLASASDAPVHLLLGTDAGKRFKAKLDAVQAEMTTWSAVTDSTDFGA